MGHKLRQRSSRAETGTSAAGTQLFFYQLHSCLFVCFLLQCLVALCEINHRSIDMTCVKYMRLHLSMDMPISYFAAFSQPEFSLEVLAYQAHLNVVYQNGFWAFDGPVQRTAFYPRVLLWRKFLLSRSGIWRRKQGISGKSGNTIRVESGIIETARENISRYRC